MADNKLHIDFDENVYFYEIDRAPYDVTDTMSKEEIDELEKKNSGFIEKVIEPNLLKCFSVCQCSMQEFMMKNERKRSILNIPPQQYQPQIEQADVDKFKFAVVVISNYGIYEGVSSIIRECKNCHKIEFWGDVEIVSHLIAEVTTNFMTNRNDETEDVLATEENPLGPDTALEDVDPELELTTTDIEPDIQNEHEFFDQSDEVPDTTNVVDSIELERTPEN